MAWNSTTQDAALPCRAQPNVPDKRATFRHRVPSGCAAEECRRRNHPYNLDIDQKQHRPASIRQSSRQVLYDQVLYERVLYDMGR